VSIFVCGYENDIATISEEGNARVFEKKALTRRTTGVSVQAGELLVFPRSWHSPHQGPVQPGNLPDNNKRKRGILRISSGAITMGRPIAMAIGDKTQISH